MKTSTIVLLVVLALVAGILGLFGWQNLATRVDLVLDLGPIGGWYLAKAFPVPYLLAITFGIGFLVAFGWFGGRSMTAARRAKAAERQVAALQDELQWAKQAPAPKPAKAAPKPLAPKKPVAPAAKKPLSLETKAPKVPVAAPPPKKEDPTDPPDFDDLI